MERGWGNGLRQLREHAEALLVAGHPSAEQAFLWLAAAAVVEESFAIVRELSPSLEMLGAHASEGVAVRLRLALADATDDWHSLLADAAAERFEHRPQSLIHARYGYWLALQERPGDAQAAYRRVIRPATDAQLWGDVLQALVSIRFLRGNYGPRDREYLTAHLLERAVDGSETLLGGRRDPHLAGLEVLQRGDIGRSEAGPHLRRFLWEARIGGHLQDALAAHTLLGDFHAEDGDQRQAAYHYIHGGLADKATKVARELLTPIDVQAALERPAAWLQAGARAVLAAQADILPDDDVPELICLCTAVVRRGRPARPPEIFFEDGLFGVWLTSLELLAAVCLRCPAELMPEVLGVVEPTIGREGGSTARDGEAVVGILVALYRAHPDQRDVLGALLVRCLTNKRLDHYALRRIRGLGWLARPLTETLRVLASEGKSPAAEILASLGDTDAAVVAYARRAVDAVLAIEPQPHPSEFNVVGTSFAISGICARLLPPERRIALARHLLHISASGVDMLVALDGIAEIARNLPDNVRDELFETVLRFGGPAMSSAEATRDFRTYMAVGAHASVVLSAALLARTPAQAERVAPLLWTALRSGHPDQHLQASSALEHMRPPGPLSVRPRAVLEASAGLRCAIPCGSRGA